MRKSGERGEGILTVIGFLSWVCLCCSPEPCQAIFWEGPLPPSCHIQKIIEREQLPALEMAGEWLKHLSKINTFNTTTTPPPSWFLSPVALFGDGSRQTLPSYWEHSVTPIFHPDFDSWVVWHMNWVAPGKWHQPDFAESLESYLKKVGHFCLSVEGNFCYCPGWERADAIPGCDYWANLHCLSSVLKYCLT